MSFQILYVCTGNLCRSVLAERLTRRFIEVRAGELAGEIRAASAGTEAIAGRPMHPRVRRILADRRADPTGFVSQRLTPELVAGADLVLAATGAERDWVITLVPTALRRSFTIREFVRLASYLDSADHRRTAPGSPPGGSPDPAAGQCATSDVETESAVTVADTARAVVSAVQAARGRTPYAEPACDDIPDPGRGRAAFRRCTERIEVSLTVILDALGLWRAPLEPAGPVR